MSVTFTTRPIILACLFSARKKKRERKREKSSKEKDRPFEFQEREQGCSFFNESLPLFRSRNSRTPRADRNQGRHSADNVASTIACWTRKTWQPSGSVGRGGGKKRKEERGNWADCGGNGVEEYVNIARYPACKSVINGTDY